MSHDRGCWKCGKDLVEYEACALLNGQECAKHSLIFPKQTKSEKKLMQEFKHVSIDKDNYQRTLKETTDNYELRMWKNSPVIHLCRIGFDRHVDFEMTWEQALKISRTIIEQHEKFKNE